MQIISPNYILTPDEVISDMSIAFENAIKKIAPLEELKKEFPDAKITTLKKNSLLMPGLINAHVHIEFSANKTELSYGDFMNWLYSVIENREDLINGCDKECMSKAIDAMLESGITTFGAISSHGMDLESCANAAQNVVFFNELIGSQAVMADTLFSDFLSRVDASKTVKRAGFYPAVAIHSPYSVHPIILQKAVNVAKQNKLPLSAPFLESQAEREWLEKGEGELKEFFEKYFNTSTPVTNITEFMHAFDTYPTHFTHCVQANKDELAYLTDKGHTIAHCPRSNRYLGCGRLAIEELDLPFSLATDGLSSNDSLSIFDELRAALMLHNDIPIQELSTRLLKTVTSDAADILGLNCGKIEVNKLADFAVVTLPEAPKRTEELALWSILHTKKVSQLYIQGEKYV